jgi:hypothetical protein
MRSELCLLHAFIIKLKLKFFRKIKLFVKLLGNRKNVYKFYLLSILVGFDRDFLWLEEDVSKF